jgi:hypothetical protein
VIIDNLYIAGVSVQPYKAQSELEVDPDRVLALAVAGERLKRITDACQVAEHLRRMKHYQFSERDALDRTELPAVLFIEDLFGFSTAEGNDQGLCYNVVRYTSSGIGWVSRLQYRAASEAVSKYVTNKVAAHTRKKRGS